MFKAAGKAKDSDEKVQLNPVRGKIYVAKTFPEWQQIVLDALKAKFLENNGFPDNKTVAAEFGKNEKLKKFQKKVMPFVAYLKVIHQLIQLLNLFNQDF